MLVPFNIVIYCHTLDTIQGLFSTIFHPWNYGKRFMKIMLDNLPHMRYSLIMQAEMCIETVTKFNPCLIVPTAPVVAFQTVGHGDFRNTMNTYKAFHKGREIEVQAETSYKAQQLAAQQFKAKKSYDVTVVIVAKDGEPIVHIADF
jgi:hypothetical protein